MRCTDLQGRLFPQSVILDDLKSITASIKTPRSSDSILILQRIVKQNLTRLLTHRQHSPPRWKRKRHTARAVSRPCHVLTRGRGEGRTPVLVLAGGKPRPGPDQGDGVPRPKTWLGTSPPLERTSDQDQWSRYPLHTVDRHTCKNSTSPSSDAGGNN